MINYEELEKYSPNDHPEHHCNDLPKYIQIYLHIYNYRWIMINIKDNYYEYIKFCPYCGQKLRENFQKNS